MSFPRQCARAMKCFGVLEKTARLANRPGQGGCCDSSKQGQIITCTAHLSGGVAGKINAQLWILVMPL